MRRQHKVLRFGGLAFFVVSVAACGVGGGNSSSSSSSLPANHAFAKVSGVATAGAPLTGLVWLKDSNGKQIGPNVIGIDGRFTFDVKGLKPPFYLCADGTVGATPYRLYSATTSAGTANIHPLSSLIVAAAAGVNDPAKSYGRSVPKTIDQAALDKAMADLMAMLKPLLNAYYSSGTNPIRDPYLGEGKRDKPD